jgi:hypothetical protein
VSDTWYRGIDEYGKYGFIHGEPGTTQYKDTDFVESEGECRISENMHDIYHPNISVDNNLVAAEWYGQKV